MKINNKLMVLTILLISLRCCIASDANVDIYDVQQQNFELIAQNNSWEIDINQIRKYAIKTSAQIQRRGHKKELIKKNKLKIDENNKIIADNSAKVSVINNTKIDVVIEAKHGSAAYVPVLYDNQKTIVPAGATAEYLISTHQNYVYRCRRPNIGKNSQGNPIVFVLGKHTYPNAYSDSPDWNAYTTSFSGPVLIQMNAWKITDDDNNALPPIFPQSPTGLQGMI